MNETKECTEENSDKLSPGWYDTSPVKASHHKLRLTDQRLGAERAERQVRMSYRWQLLVSQIKGVYCVPRFLVCSNQSLLQQSSWKTWSFSIEFWGLRVTGKCSSHFTEKEVGHEELMWGNLIFHKQQVNGGTGNITCVFWGCTSFTGLHYQLRPFAHTTRLCSDEHRPAQLIKSQFRNPAFGHVIRNQRFKHHSLGLWVMIAAQSKANSDRPAGCTWI